MTDAWRYGHCKRPLPSTVRLSSKQLPVNCWQLSEPVERLSAVHLINRTGPLFNQRVIVPRGEPPGCRFISEDHHARTRREFSAQPAWLPTDAIRTALQTSITRCQMSTSNTSWQQCPPISERDCFNAGRTKSVD
jgi:hypothetical protein